MYDRNERNRTHRWLRTDRAAISQASLPALKISQISQVSLRLPLTNSYIWWDLRCYSWFSYEIEHFCVVLGYQTFIPISCLEFASPEIMITHDFRSVSVLKFPNVRSSPFPFTEIRFHYQSVVLVRSEICSFHFVLSPRFVVQISSFVQISVRFAQVITTAIGVLMWLVIDHFVLFLWSLRFMYLRLR